MQGNDNKIDIVTKAEFAIWQTERAWLLHDIQMLRNLLSALKTSLETQKLDMGQRYDWMYSIEFLLNEVVDPAMSDSDSLDDTEPPTEAIA